MRTADIRYSGQSYELTVPWNARNPGEPFHREHQRIYGYANPDRAIEVRDPGLVHLAVEVLEQVLAPGGGPRERGERLVQAAPVEVGVEVPEAGRQAAAHLPVRGGVLAKM